MDTVVKFCEKSPTLKEAQEFVGGYVQTVELDEGDVMIVNEEGLLQELPLNVEASDIAFQPIVGNVMIVSSDERGQDW